MMPCRKKSGSRQLVTRMKTLKMMMMFRMKELRKSPAKSKNVKRRVKMTNQKRKRKKEPSKNGKKQKRKEESEDDEPKKKKKKGAFKKLQKQMRKLLEIVIQYEDQDGRVLSDPFMKLPTRKELPDYYEVIRKPVDISKILTKIE